MKNEDGDQTLANVVLTILGESTRMEHRPRRYEISGPTLIDAHILSTSIPSKPPPLKTNNGAILFPSSGFNRPLSDIRELSEPSMMDDIVRKPSVAFGHRRSPAKPSSILRKPSIRHVASDKSIKLAFEAAHVRERPHDNGSSSYSSTPEQPNVYSVPYSNVPRRSSSLKRVAGPSTVKTCEALACDRPPSVHTTPHAPQPVFRSRESSSSPVEETNVRMEHPPADMNTQGSARTRVRNPHPSEILDFPCYKHPRVKVDMQVSAPLFVGGGSVEGHVRLTVDGNNPLKHYRSLSLGIVSVDLLGFEDVSMDRKSVFLAVGTDIIDSDHPPPSRITESTHPFLPNGDYWPVTPSSVSLPFGISLPLQPGPPPFQSRHACIRYLLAVTAALRDAGKNYRVRTSQDIQVLPTYDPEKALTSLRSPLVSCDQFILRRGTVQETIKVEANLHRQVWVSGGSIFVDVHISNMSRKAVKRLELSLERDILCYKHAAASTKERSASQARIFESNEQALLVKTVFKPGAMGWDGVDPQSSNTRTYQLALPRGHGTVRCGKYFEVRYFLNVTAIVSSSKYVSVQLPIILIHINSLDVVPNSIVQVATAIEEKRADVRRKRSQHKQSRDEHRRQRSVSSSLGADLRRRPSYGQGRAFSAPRQQSLDRQREQQAEIDELRRAVDSSPRKAACSTAQRSAMKKPASNLSLYSLANRSQEFDGPFATGAIPSNDASVGRMQKAKNCNDTPTLLSRLRSMRSFDTFRSRSHRDQYHNPTVNRCASQQSIYGTQTSTLAKANSAVDSNPSLWLSAAAQTTNGMENRVKLDPGRFDLKAIGRKASGGLKERGLNWLEQKRKERDRERERNGWI